MKKKLLYMFHLIAALALMLGLIPASAVAAPEAPEAPATTEQLDFSAIFNQDVVRETNCATTGQFDSFAAYIGSGCATANGNPSDDGLPEDGVFLANSDHPEVDLDWGSGATPPTNYNAWVVGGTGSQTADVTDGHYKEVHVFAATAEDPTQAADFKITLNYTDSTTYESATFKAEDWYNPPAPGSYALIDDMDRWHTPPVNAYDDRNAFAIFGYAVLVDESKVLDSVTIQVVNVGTQVFAFFGGVATDGSYMDSNGDGIGDSEQCPNFPNCPDTDNDGIPDHKDEDIDGDNIDNDVECPNPSVGCTDTDGDTIPDYREPNNADSDGDGDPDHCDTDSDNDDTVSDARLDGEEGDADNDQDGILDRFESNDYDSDGDGLNDYEDDDSDADGIPDGCGVCNVPTCTLTIFNCERFSDTDHDNIPDRLESNYFDTDGGGLPDYLDVDTDGDGEWDRDEGGAPDGAFADGDSDGVPDRLESDKNDSDGDGLYDEGDDNSDDDSAGDDGNEATGDPDGFYNDKDADGIPDRYEANVFSSDTDCTADDSDTDADGDSISDHDEWYRDTDGDHVPDRYESNVVDTDVDGDVDYLDTDSDDDGIEDGDHNEDINYDEGEGVYDDDSDYVPNRVEPDDHYSDADTTDDAHDTDSDDDTKLDGYCNGGEGLDDTDGDGVLDRFESSIRDSDGDDIVDELDTDSDDDGTPDGGPGERLDDEADDRVPNRIESSIAHSDGLLSGNVDELNGNSDDDVVGGDDVAGERLDDDVDVDGIPDRLEADDHYSDAIGKDAFVGAYPDGYDENDTDADNDCIYDGDTDGGADHEEEGLGDADGDGVPDRLESNDRDTDGDGTVDYLDSDSDGDGTADGVEWLLDSDGDFIPDRLESNTADTDGDGTPNYLDLDSDGDNIPDHVEILDATCDGGFLGDRDGNVGDGWWNYVDHDPTGYFYNRITGEIVASEEMSISVEGPPGAVITITHYGNEGFYQFSTDGTAGVYTLTLNGVPPTGYALDWAHCPPLPGPYNPPAPEIPPYDPADVSGSFNGENQDTGYLMAAGCTDYYLTFYLGSNDKIIINNNIPLIPTVGGLTEPVDRMALLSPVLLLAATVALGAIAAVTLKRRTA
jgi:hypothetical protein